MSGQALSSYCGFLNEYYELLATGQIDASEALADDMDLLWEDLTEEERNTVRQHADVLAERYAS